jgi:hypothetical protein
MFPPAGERDTCSPALHHPDSLRAGSPAGNWRSSRDHRPPEELPLSSPFPSRGMASARWQTCSAATRAGDCEMAMVAGVVPCGVSVSRQLARAGVQPEGRENCCGHGHIADGVAAPNVMRGHLRRSVAMWRFRQERAVKPVGSAYAGSNPTPATHFRRSKPVTRSCVTGFPCRTRGYENRRLCPVGIPGPDPACVPSSHPEGSWPPGARLPPP